MKRERAGLGPVSIVAGGEEGEDRIADDIEHLAALLHHRARGAIEIGVEQVEKGIDRELIGKARRVAQIAVPKRGCEPLAIAALDGAGEDAAADQRPMKGVERIPRDLVLDGDAEDERKRPKHAAHGGDVGGAEALGAPRRPRGGDAVIGLRMELGAAEGHDQRKIIGEALLFQLREQREAGDGGIGIEAEPPLRLPSLSMT